PVIAVRAGAVVSSTAARVGNGTRASAMALPEVPPLRRILTSQITEPEQVNRYPEPARYLPDLIDGQCLLPAQYVRHPALGVPHRRSDLLLRPAVRAPDLLQERGEVATRERGGDG